MSEMARNVRVRMAEIHERVGASHSVGRGELDKLEQWILQCSPMDAFDAAAIHEALNGINLIKSRLGKTS